MPYKVNKGIPTNSFKTLVVIIGLLAAKMIEFASELVGLTITGAALNTKNAALSAASSKSKGHDPVGTAEQKIIALSLREDYKKVATFVENSINLSNDPTLAAKLTLVLGKSKGKVTIAPLSVYNTVIPGRVRLVLASVKAAHSYIVECTQIAEDGSVISTFEKTIPLTKGIIEGLVQGAKYMFRAHALTTNAVGEVWTDYVVLRIS